ncbi:hypothetical protein L2E82_01039 [Cichorium intybus]|uniref:Uncharacterized protein n=1 Tax=Cichorium intybus TaxID=13427 RepID=A0ACB9GXT4_CICIN|nr:hypothetical protein L2E82_01039 [Cichorium intybus]
MSFLTVGISLFLLLSTLVHPSSSNMHYEGAVSSFNTFDKKHKDIELPCEILMISFSFLFFKEKKVSQAPSDVTDNDVIWNKICYNDIVV